MKAYMNTLECAVVLRFSPLWKMEYIFLKI